MSRESNLYKFIFAGGGTGGHLYPAIAVAEQIKNLKPESEILFVGTKEKIEARILPKLGFDFKSIWISGFTRKFKLKNLLFPFKIIVSAIQSLIINMKFKSRVAVGSGAYVAGPVIWSASVLGSKIILLEQNSYPGLTNRMLEKKADQIHISFEDSKKYFREKSKLSLTGNPIRIDLTTVDKEKAVSVFNLDYAKKTLLVLGGSLGALSINEAIAMNVKPLVENNIQIIWQTGEQYYNKYKVHESNGVRVLPFIDDMSIAYSACDLVVARAGATTIAEVSCLGLPVVFVPSPNVAANHQFINAKSLQEKGAGILLADSKLKKKLLSTVNEIIQDKPKLFELSENIKKFSKPDAAKTIAENAIKLAEQF